MTAQSIYRWCEHFVPHRARAHRAARRHRPHRRRRRRRPRAARGTCGRCRTAFSERFTNGSDSGSLLTHQHLLAGDAAPLLLAPAASADDTDDSDATAAALLAGVIAVGVGDAAAEAADVAHGRARWPGRSAMTLEGSAAALGAMLAATYGLRAAATATAKKTAQCGSLCARRRRRRLSVEAANESRSALPQPPPYTAAPHWTPAVYSSSLVCTLRAALICTHVRSI